MCEVFCFFFFKTIFIVDFFFFNSLKATSIQDSNIDHLFCLLSRKGVLLGQECLQADFSHLVAQLWAGGWQELCVLGLCRGKCAAGTVPLSAGWDAGGEGEGRDTDSVQIALVCELISTSIIKTIFIVLHMFSFVFPNKNATVNI